VFQNIIVRNINLNARSGTTNFDKNSGIVATIVPMPIPQNIRELFRLKIADFLLYFIKSFSQETSITANGPEPPIPLLPKPPIIATPPRSRLFEVKRAIVAQIIRII